MKQYRKLFPACDRLVYLNNAGVSPTSTRVRDAAVAWIDELQSLGPGKEPDWEQRAENARQQVAALMDVQSDEIAFVRSTSHGLGLVAEGIDWKPDDEVAVCMDAEYPSNVYPWQHLQKRGVRLCKVPMQRGGMTPEALQAVINKKTRLVSVSAVQYASGHMTRLADIGDICRKNNSLLCVDGIQQLGAFPLDAKKWGIHFLAADSHKWLLGMNGAGLLYVDKTVVRDIRPVLVGWKSTTDAWNFDQAKFELRPDATRFEEGSPAYFGIWGIGAAASLLTEVGIDNVARKIQELIAELEQGLLALSCSVGPEPADRAGILTFTPPSGNIEDVSSLADSIEQAGIVVSVRRQRIRVSPHFFNNSDDIQALLSVVKKHQTAG